MEKTASKYQKGQVITIDDKPAPFATEILDVEWDEQNQQYRYWFVHEGDRYHIYENQI